MTAKGEAVHVMGVPDPTVTAQSAMIEGAAVTHAHDGVQPHAVGALVISTSPGFGEPARIASAGGAHASATLELVEVLELIVEVDQVVELVELVEIVELLELVDVELLACPLLDELLELSGCESDTD